MDIILTATESVLWPIENWKGTVGEALWPRLPLTREEPGAVGGERLDGTPCRSVTTGQSSPDCCLMP